MPFEDLGYRFTVSIPTISHVLSAWMVVMDATLLSLVYWPEAEKLWQTMSMCFQCAFRNKVTVVIDCLELFIERPTNLLARANFFISQAPQYHKNSHRNYTSRKHIMYLKPGWGTSDKFLTENHQFLQDLPTGNMVMAKLVILASPKENPKRTSFIYLRKATRIASVCIHVERVIRLLWRKYFRRYTAYWLSCM